MKTESYIRILAGSMVLLSLALAYFVSPWWQLLAVFVALNLIQSAITGFCPPEILLRKWGVEQGGCSCRAPGKSEKKD